MSVTTRSYTYADLLDMPEDDGNRYEIIDGELFVSAAPTKRHQRMLALLFLSFSMHVEFRRLGEVFFAPVDVLFSERNVVEPDIIYIRRDRLHIYGDRVCTGPPDVVLEALSPSTRMRDLTQKFALFEFNGVPEYWIADPETPDLLLYVLDDLGHYQRVDPIAGRLHSRVIPDFSIDLQAILADVAAH